MLLLIEPSLLTVNDPMPLFPTVKNAVPVKLEPLPVTVTDPSEPVPFAMLTLWFVLFTTPPLWILSVPMPLVPTKKFPELVQVEPAPVTVAVLVDAAAFAMVALALVTAPPL